MSSPHPLDTPASSPQIPAPGPIHDHSRTPPQDLPRQGQGQDRSEEHTSELQSLMRISYAVFCLKKKTTQSELNLRSRHNTKQNVIEISAARRSSDKTTT